MRRDRLKTDVIGLLALAIALDAVAVCAQPAPSAPAARLPAPTATVPAGPSRRIMIGLPSPSFETNGEMSLRPNVAVAPRAAGEAPPPARGPQSPENSAAYRSIPATYTPGDALPEYDLYPGEMPVPSDYGPPQPMELEPVATPLFAPIDHFFAGIAEVGSSVPTTVAGGTFLEPVAQPIFDKTVCGPPGLVDCACEDEDSGGGIGRERVMFAPFEIDITQPLNNFRLRYDSAWGWKRPDRAEFFWSKARAQGGKGPPFIERNVDYQDVRILMEIPAGPKFSALTELPIRFVNPDINQNTGGLGDMNIATKLVLIDGQHWQITQLFRTYLMTGSAKAGLSAGHVALEPGFLFRYKWDDITYFHSELKFNFPIAGDPTFSGQVLNYGLGISRVMYDSDAWALIPTLEWVGWTAIDGFETPFPAGPPERVDPVSIGTLNPGLRIVHDHGCDLGLLEIGISAAFALTDQHWYNALARLDFRWSY